MKVPFYGHVRQYTALKSEIDANIKTVIESGDGAMGYDLDMPPYIQDMAEWLDDPLNVHACHFESAYKGMEIMMGLCRSAAEGGQVALPLTAPADELDLLKKAVSDRTVLLSDPVNAKEYGV